MKIEWHGNELMQVVVKASEEASKEIAEAIVKDAKNNLNRHIRRTKKSKSRGTLGAHIQTRKSKFKDGGYLAGVFAKDFRPWEDTLGARAVFVEFGHAAPYKGRKYVTRKNIVKHIPPRPFLRPAIRKHKRKVKRTFNEKINRYLNQ